MQYIDLTDIYKEKITQNTFLHIKYVTSCTKHIVFLQ